MIIKTFIDIKMKIIQELVELKYLAEHKLSTETNSPKKLLNWFGSDEPLSGFGKMILGESIFRTRQYTKRYKN